MFEIKWYTKPKYWILRCPDGTRTVRPVMTEQEDDRPKYLSHGTVIEVLIEPELTPENQKLFEAIVRLDEALQARGTPHLRDLLGELVLKAYEAGCKQPKPDRRKNPAVMTRP